MTIPKFTLAGGTPIPAIAFGAATASPGPDLKQDTIERLKSAIKVGYRHIDTAQVYTTEAEVGIAIADSGIPREEFFVTSKVLSVKGSIDNIEATIRKGLKAAKLDYFDLYLIHGPFFTKEKEGVSVEEAWAQMEDIKTKGLARNIGVSNFRPETLEKLLNVAKIKPVVNQIELNPYCLEEDTVELCRKHGITIESYGPLIPIARRTDGPITSLIEELAKKYAVSPAQILLRWQLQNGFIPVTSSSDPNRQQTQFDLESFELSEEDVRRIKEVGSGLHFRYFGWGTGRATYDVNAPMSRPSNLRL